MVNVNSDKEWIRRRQMRLMQVRKQSSDIAKMLRERVVDEEMQRKVAEDEEMELNLNLWKFRRLNDLEEMYRKAIKDFGSGHELASKEPAPGKPERQKEYLCKARRRGESALQQELKIKEEAEKKKTVPIQRKMITRKIEDLRSMLVRSIAAKKSSAFSRNVCVEKVFDPKLFESREEVEEPDIEELSDQERKNGVKKQLHPVKVTFQDEAIRKKVAHKKEKGKKKALEKNKDKPDVKCEEQKRSGAIKDGTSKLNRLKSNRLWVDLGVVEVLTENEEHERKEGEPVLLKIEKDCRKEKRPNPKEKTAKKEKNIVPKKEEKVECRGYSFSHNCNLKDNTGLVQRMDNHSEPDAVELAFREEEKRLLRTDEEKNRKMIAKERGSRAILKEKVNKSFTELLTKLEKLSTKEKLIKTYCHLPPSDVFFSDDRRREKLSKKQQKMDSEFERIYYNVKGVNPDFNSQNQFNLAARAEGDEPDNEQGNFVTKLDFSQLKSDLKGNGRASSCCCGKEKEESNTGYEPTEKVTIKKTPSSFCYKRTKVIRGGKKAISDIDKVLEKGRKLRQESLRVSGLPSRECKSDNDFSDRKSDAREENNSQARDTSLGSLESGSIELELNKFESLSQSEGDRVSDILHDLKKSLAPKSKPPDTSKAILEDLGMGDLGNNFPHVTNNIIAWPVHRVDRSRDMDDSFGNTTTYMSLPDGGNSEKFRDLIEILDELKGRDEGSMLPDDKLEKLEDLLCSVMGELEISYTSSCNNDSWSSQESSDLSNYISKLLDMSREQVSKLLDSSSECESPPKRHDSLECDKSPTKEGKCPNSPGENRSPQAKAKELDSIITEWKSVLEQVTENSPKAESPKTLERDKKTYMKCTKKTCERQSKSRERRTPKMMSSEFSHSTRNSCSEREITEEGGVCKDERSKTPEGEWKTIPSFNSKMHQSRDPSVKSCHESHESHERRETPIEGSGAGAFICDERTCPYLNHSLPDYPNVMDHLLNTGMIRSPFKWDKKDSGSNKSFFTPDDVNKMCKLKRCKFGCTSPCPGHTEILKRRPFEGENSEEDEDNENPPNAPVSPPHRFFRNMNYHDVCTGIYSPFPWIMKRQFIRKQSKEGPPRVPIPDLNDPKKKFHSSPPMDWDRYIPTTVWNIHRPLMTRRRPKYVPKPVYTNGRIWRRDTDESSDSSVVENSLADEYLGYFMINAPDFDERYPPGCLSDSMEEDRAYRLFKLKQRKEANMECHGCEDDCDSRCNKDPRAAIFKRLMKKWSEYESQRHGSANPPGDPCFYSCPYHCQKRKKDSDESESNSSSDFDANADDSCCNTCPAHCDVPETNEGYEASDDSTPISPPKPYSSHANWPKIVRTPPKTPKEETPKERVLERNKLTNMMFA